MLNQDTFFDKFKVKDLFEKSGLEWETLEKIYDDYSGRYDDIKILVEKLTKRLLIILQYQYTP